MQKGVITMCYIGDTAIIGSLVGGKMLRSPRILRPTEGGFQLRLFPWNPDHVVMGDAAIRYPIPNAGDDIHLFYEAILRKPDPIDVMKDAPETEANEA